MITVVSNLVQFLCRRLAPWATLDELLDKLVFSVVSDDGMQLGHDQGEHTDEIPRPDLCVKFLAHISTLCEASPGVTCNAEENAATRPPVI